MESLIDIQSRIAKLEQQATEIRSREFDSTVKDILAKMRAFGITIKDLSSKSSVGKGKVSPTGKKQAVKHTKKGQGVKVAARYRGPEGDTWSGRGLTPRWLKAQLDSGKSKEDFLIKN
jgi:DNA-binding protein H-NS